MATRRSIEEPRTRQFFQRQQQRRDTQNEVLESLIIAPSYQIVRALEDTTPLESARVTFDGRDGGSGVDVYNSGYYDNTPFYASFPGAEQGSRLDEAFSFLVASFGAGASQTLNVLNRPATAQQLLDRGSGVELGEQGTGGLGTRTVQFPGVDFTVLLADFTLQGLGTLPPPEPNYLEDDILYVYFDSYPTRPARVVGVDPSNRDTLIIEDDVFVPQLSNTAASLVSNPAWFEFFSSGQKAQLPVAGHTVSEGAANTAATTAGTSVAYNFDVTNTWEVVFVDPGGAATDLSVSVAFTAASNSGVITVNLGRTGSALDDTKNTIGLINAAIRDAFKGQSPVHETPVQFAPETGAIDDPTPFNSAASASSGAITARTENWVGRVEAKVSGSDGTKYRVTLQSGVVADPSIERVGDHFIITLGTVPANNTVDAVNALIDAKTVNLQDGIRFVTTGTSSTDEIDTLSLGSRITHAGYVSTQWDPTDQSKFLGGGLDASSFELYGGLIPHYDVAAATVVQASIYAEYRALRVSMSRAASPLTTGNRPALTRYRLDDYIEKNEEISVDNPMGLALEIFFSASQSRQVFGLSPEAVSADKPWGTAEAIREALVFAQKREVYHVYILSDDPEAAEEVYQAAINIGGTETEALKRPQIFYFSTKNFEISPDLPIAAGSVATKQGSAELVLDSNVSSDEVLDPAKLAAGRYVISFVSDASNIGGDATLQDGSVGFSLSAKNVGGSPFTITVAGSLGAGPFGSYQIFETGASLYDGSNVYDAATAISILEEWGALTSQKRVARHHCDGFEFQLNGQFTQLDGVYLLASFAGLVAASPDQIPVSKVTYPGVRNVQGTSDLYSLEQMNFLTGAGYILPIQNGDSDRAPVYVRRDVSSDTSTLVFRRRTAGVSEDKLSIEVDRLITPRLGAALVTDQFLDRLAMDLDNLFQRYKQDSVFKNINLLNVLPITDEIRAQFGIEDSGVFILAEYEHLEEVGTAIFKHIVRG